MAIILLEDRVQAHPTFGRSGRRFPRDLPRDFYAITELAAFTGDTCAINLATTRRNEKTECCYNVVKFLFPKFGEKTKRLGATSWKIIKNAMFRNE